VGGIGPTVEGWAAGDRQVWCGASAREGTAPPPDVDGAYVLFTGKVAGQSQTLVDPPGTCRAAEADWPVPCDQVHSWEVTGTADVTGKVNGPPAPGDSKGWDRLVGADCKRLGTAYLGHPPTGDVNSGWIAIEPGGWAAGRRLVECVVARYQNDDRLAQGLRSGRSAGSGPSENRANRTFSCAASVPLSRAPSRNAVRVFKRGYAGGASVTLVT
jgi:hypothetical protein